MKKISLTFCLALLSSLFCPAQVSPLQFNKNGEFKIVQFTDIHFKYGNPASDIAEWCSLIPLTKLSIENGSVPVEVPDFTRGAWNKIQGYRHAFAQ